MPAIAASVFVNMTPQGLKNTNPTLYYYYNHLDIPEDSYALIHNGRDFGVIQIVKNLSTDNIKAAAKVKKPLLTHIHYDEDLLKVASMALTTLELSASKALLQAQLEADLKGESP